MLYDFHVSQPEIQDNPISVIYNLGKQKRKLNNKIPVE